MPKEFKFDGGSLHFADDFLWVNSSAGQISIALKFKEVLTVWDAVYDMNRSALRRPCDEHSAQISEEFYLTFGDFDQSEDSFNLSIDVKRATIILALKLSALPSLAEFFAAAVVEFHPGKRQHGLYGKEKFFQSPEILRFVLEAVKQ